MLNLLPKLTPEQIAPFLHIKNYEYFLSYYFQSRLGRKKPILAAMKLTQSCNLRCAHCPFCQEDGNLLSWEQAISCMKTLHRWGVRLLIFEGGEPFLWRDKKHELHHLVEEARKLFFSVGVVTNGTFAIDVHADIVWVSIDGLRETHNRLRAKSFDAVMTNIAVSSHPRLFAHVTINAVNWQEVPELVRFLSDKVHGITVQFHYPYRQDAVDEALFLPVEARHEVLESLISLKRQGMPVVDSYACLEALKANRWQCHSWMLATVEADGTMSKGCYAKNRTDIACDRCGFAAHTEISLAYSGNIEAMLVGKQIFERTT